MIIWRDTSQQRKSMTLTEYERCEQNLCTQAPCSVKESILTLSSVTEEEILYSIDTIQKVQMLLLSAVIMHFSSIFCPISQSSIIRRDRTKWSIFWHCIDIIRLRGKCNICNVSAIFRAVALWWVEYFVALTQFGRYKRQNRSMQHMIYTPCSDVWNYRWKWS